MSISNLRLWFVDHSPSAAIGNLLQHPGHPTMTDDSQQPSNSLSFDASKSPVTIAIGIDLIERKRLLRTFEQFGERFLQRVFTPTELAQAHHQIGRLVGRFAAKEACS